MIFALKPYFCVSNCAWMIAALHFANSSFGASYHPCSPSVSVWALKSNIVEKWPVSPINSGNSSGFMLNTSPTVKASYFSKVDFFRSSNSSPTPSTLSTIFQQLARPSFPSGAKSGKFRSFLMFMIASIRKPERPFSSHQLIILYSSCRNFGFSQFRSGCSFANMWK